MASQPLKYLRNTTGIPSCCPGEEQCRRQHVIHCRDPLMEEPARSSMARSTHLRRPYMKPLSFLLEQAPPSRILNLMTTCRLETRHRDFLWQQGPQEIRQALLDCDGFLTSLTESQARDILTTGNISLLCRLASLLPGRAPPIAFPGSRTISCGGICANTPICASVKRWPAMTTFPRHLASLWQTGYASICLSAGRPFAICGRPTWPFCSRLPISDCSKRSRSSSTSATAAYAKPSSRACGTIRSARPSGAVRNIANPLPFPAPTQGGTLSR